MKIQKTEGQTFNGNGVIKNLNKTKKFVTTPVRDKLLSNLCDEYMKCGFSAPIFETNQNLASKLKVYFEATLNTELPKFDKTMLLRSFNSDGSQKIIIANHLQEKGKNNVVWNIIVDNVKPKK